MSQHQQRLPHLNLLDHQHQYQHLNDFQLAEVLQSFRRILKNNGTIIFATPAKDGLAHFIKKNDWIGYSDTTHINLKSFEEWLEFFKSKNLNLIKSSNDGLWDFPYNTKNRKIVIIKILFRCPMAVICLYYQFDLFDLIVRIHQSTQLNSMI